MKCRLCRWFCDRFCSPEARVGFWSHIYEWEDNYANKWKPWDENEDRREQAYRINTIVEDDPAAAFQLSRELAAEGSIHAMRWAAWFYSGQGGVLANEELRKSYMVQAAEHGSYSAGLQRADIAFRGKDHETWRDILSRYGEEGFAPALFHHAWNEFKLRPEKDTVRRMRPLLDQAAEAGHPGAKALLGTWSLRGYFGLGEVLNGIRLLKGAFLVYTRARSN